MLRGLPADAIDTDTIGADTVDGEISWIIMPVRNIVAGWKLERER